MNDLESWFLGDDHRLATKWAHYFEIYDRHLSRYRGSPVTLVEIGVFHGGSLQMWREYFGSAASIIGVDIDPRTKKFEEDGVDVIIGDQGDRDFLRQLAAGTPQIDILIDDGGHTMMQQKATLEVMLPHLAADGVYICEDLHTSYWSEYGGGYRRRSSFVEHAKMLVDSLNAWHSQTRRLKVTENTRSIYGLHFYDSVLVIEKRPMDPPRSLTRGKPAFQMSQPTVARRIYNRFPAVVKSTLRQVRRPYQAFRSRLQGFGARFRQRKSPQP